MSSRSISASGSSANQNRSSQPLTKFTSFPNLPAELRLKIWDHALPPRVFEVHCSHHHIGYQFAVESKPKMLAIHAVNSEARREFLRSYKQVTLNRRAATLYQPGDPALVRCFFSPVKDTLYIAEDSERMRSYYRSSLFFLNPDFLNSVQHLAIQAESFTSKEFNTGPPYNTISHATTSKAASLNDMLKLFPRIQTLSLVVGDDFSLQPRYLSILAGFTSKPTGELNLMELTSGRKATEEFYSAEDQVWSWIDFLLGHFPALLNKPEVEVKEAMRGGKLTMIDILGLLEEDSD
ncbi:hypothetical protein V8E51_015832 [Hyaloscypha variabilis]